MLLKDNFRAKQVKSVYKREISQTEQSYIELNRSSSQSVIQIILEGEGNLDIDHIKNSVIWASTEACPDARVRRKGNWWVDSKLSPQVYEVNAFGWNGKNFEDPRLNKQIFNKRMNPTKDPLCEVFYIKRDKNLVSILFRIFHGIMDGQGALIFIENVFRSIRSERLIDVDWRETDLEFIKKLNPPNYSTSLKLDHVFKTKSSSLFNKEIYWKRISIPFNYMGIIPKLALELSKYFENGETKFLVPSDLRRYKKGMIATSNLSLPLYINVTRNKDWSSVYKNMYKDLVLKKEINIKNADFGGLLSLPSFLIQFLLNIIVLYQNITSKYLNGGTISSLGKINLNSFSSEDYISHSLYSLPTHQPLVPFSFAITESVSKTEITFSSYKNVISPEMADRILLSISQSM